MSETKQFVEGIGGCGVNMTSVIGNNQKGDTIQSFKFVFFQKGGQDLLFSTSQGIEIQNFLATEVNKIDAINKMGLIDIEHMKKFCIKGAKVKHCMYCTTKSTGEPLCGKIFPALEKVLKEKSKEKGMPKGDNCSGVGRAPVVKGNKIKPFTVVEKK